MILVLWLKSINTNVRLKCTENNSNINELLTQIRHDCYPTKSFAHLWPWAWGQWPLICQHQLRSSDLTGCTCLHPGQSLRKRYDWSGTFSWCHVLSLKNSRTFLFTHVHWLQRSPNEFPWKTDFCLITWSHLFWSATMSTIDWSLLSIHIQCASYCIAPHINPI